MPLWGAPRIHGGDCSSSGLRSRSRASPITWSSDGRRPTRDGEPSCVTHAPDIAAMESVRCSNYRFRPALCPPSLSDSTAEALVWINVTANPTAKWVARQITEAFPWDEAPRHLIRDRDRIYGSVVPRRLRAMGIRDGSLPHQPRPGRGHGFAERLIGSIKREWCGPHHCLGRDAFASGPPNPTPTNTIASERIDP